MESYTDLEQSKKLSEILPLESADMCYPLPYEEGDKPLLEQGGFGSTPCWSIAALLNILPILDNRSPVISKTFDGKYRVIYHATPYERTILTSDSNNPIDACCEMILKLHELKML